MKQIGNPKFNSVNVSNWTHKVKPQLKYNNTGQTAVIKYNTQRNNNHETQPINNDVYYGDQFDIKV